MRYYVTEKRVNEYIQYHLTYSFINKEDFIEDINTTLLNLSGEDKAQKRFYDAVKNKLNTTN